MIRREDYVYIFGLEWADELLAAMEVDPEAGRALARNCLTLDDVRKFYLRPPHFQRVYNGLVERGSDPLMSPVEVLIDLIALEKALAQADPATARRGRALRGTRW